MKKNTIRSDEENKKIISRINRIKGQLDGIKNMIEQNRDCNDILIQLSAAQKSVTSISNYMLENHLYSCVTKDLEDGNLDVIDELISLFKRFNK